nr:aminotransferase class I/II-fold pyridoxal phosphate-dependent enzyme [Actinomycetes bacterium]
LAQRYPNVVVLRTFSKAYGLAGLRVGFAVGDPDVVTALGKVYVPFTSSTISQAAAIASLQAADELLARTDTVVAERNRVGAALAELGYEFPSSQANFIWLPLGERTGEFARQAAQARVLVRPYTGEGARVSIGAPEENDAFLRFAQQWAVN